MLRHISAVLLFILFAVPVHAQAATVDCVGATTTITITEGATTAIAEDCTLSGMLTMDTGTTMINGGGFTVTAAPNSRHFFASVAAASLALNNVTLTGGNDATGGGGAIASDGPLTITNSTLSGNATTTSGGAVLMGTDGTLTITGSTLSGNSATLAGGAIATDSPLTIAGSTLSSNSADNVGGAIVSRAPVTITDSTLSGNSANSPDLGGGAIYILTLPDNPLPMTITNSTFSGNSAESGGGAIYVFNLDPMTITDSTFSGNSANRPFAGSGGATSIIGGTTTITNSTFSNNSAALSSGAINVGGSGNVTLNNSTLFGNSAEFTAGAVSLNSGTVTFNNSTISGNSPGRGRGGIVTISSSGTFNFNNTIVANNNTDTSVDCTSDSLGTVNFSAAGTNIIGRDAPLIGSLVPCDPNGLSLRGDAGVGALADNGGAVQTVALLPGSPAINAGDNAAAVDADSNPFTTDARGTGFPRVLGGVVDLGAFEYSFAEVPEDVNASGFVTPADGVYVINRLGQSKNSSNATADVNNDETIDEEDVNLVISKIGTSNP